MIIETIKTQKRFFDVNDKKDLSLAKQFFENHKWESACPFILEFPYTSVPDMIKDKMIHKIFNIKYDRMHHRV